MARASWCPPGGHTPGVHARTDVGHGVFKAPANEILCGVFELEAHITDAWHGLLNPRDVNVIRSFSGRGIHVWGAQTMS